VKYHERCVQKVFIYDDITCVNFTDVVKACEESRNSWFDKIWSHQMEFSLKYI